MDSIRLKNYRCFDDTGYVDIKPITMLLGANSSGKSSFLKFLPLLKQSVGVGTKGSFLWNSDDVDFNNFQNTIKDGSDEMVVSMQINNLPLTRRYNTFKQFFDTININMYLKAIDNDFDYLSKLVISFDKIEFEINYEDYYSISSLRVNDLLLESNDKLHIKSVFTNSLLPKVQINKSNSLFSEELDEIESLFYSAIGVPKTDNIYRRALIAAFRKIINLDSLRNYVIGNLNKSFSAEETDRIANIMLLYNINNVIDSLNLYFLSFASSLNYVQPIRVVSERYYRFQNFAVQNIDSDGRNLSMFFNSLSEDEMEDLNNWLSSTFEFKLKVSHTGGSIEIIIEEQGKNPRNMVDVGFGYTQCLPILVLIWKVVVIDCGNVRNKDKEKYCKEHIIAIEQPELHLHPRFQALFAEMIVKAIKYCKERDRDVRFVVETHSESIINKLGEMVACNFVDKEDINIVIFNATHEGLAAYVEQTKFTEEGFITNWPYGFFSYVDRSKK